MGYHVNMRKGEQFIEKLALAGIVYKYYKTTNGWFVHVDDRHEEAAVLYEEVMQLRSLHRRAGHR